MRSWPFHALSALVVAGFSYMVWLAVCGSEGAVRNMLAATAVWQLLDSALTWYKFAREKCTS